MRKPLVLDVETQHTFQEVGKDPVKLKVSVVGVYDYNEDDYRAYLEDKLSELFQKIEHAPYTIGFNIDRFDFPVLSPYYLGSIDQFETLDILEKVKESIGFRVALDSLAKATLGVKKIGHGFKAIDYFKTGKFEKLKKYCLKDVEITKKLYDFGKKQGYLYLDTHKGKREVPVDFSLKKKKDKNVALSLPV